MSGHTGPLALLVNFDHADASRPPAEQALRGAGFALAQAATAEAALARAGRADLVLLRASSAVADDLRRLKGGPEAVAPLLCLSDSAAQRVAALGGGADACLPAAVGADELAAVALALVRHGRAAGRAESELRDADRRKDAFLAMLAHELRGPLAPLTNALQLLRLRAGDPAAVEQARELAERQVRQLARLVDDLLDVSRVAQGKLHIVRDRVDVAQAVAQAVETARPLIEARGHELNVLLPPEPPGLEADPARLVQILSNLLTNAARYTPEGGKVWLSAERDGGDVLFRVRDTGVGLTPEMLPRVFDLFAQAQQGAQGGLGVGLALVRGLAELHGGAVLAYSDGPGEGSEFVVRLPGLPQGAAAAPKPRPAGKAAAGPPRRVMVVDDNIDAAESMAALLRLGGHEVSVAHDGLSALEVARQERPGVVLLDIGLPGGLDGHQVARLLRRERGLEGALLVALTGFGQQEDRRRALEAGCDHFLVKPIEVQALERLLERASGSGSKSGKAP